jgi:hypothetical protein
MRPLHRARPPGIIDNSPVFTAASINTEQNVMDVDQREMKP